MLPIHNIYLFIKSQVGFLAFLIIGMVLPYYLVCRYMSKIPYIHYIFLIAITFIKLFVLNEKTQEKKYTPIAQSELTRELKRNPSGKEIYARVRFYVRSKDAALILTALSIITLAIMFQKV